MKIKIGKMIDNMLSAANEVCKDTLEEVKVQMQRTQTVELKVDGGYTLKYPQETEAAYKRLTEMLDEIYVAKVNFNLQVNQLPAQNFADNVKEILGRTKKQHLDFIDECSIITLQIK